MTTDITCESSEVESIRINHDIWKLTKIPNIGIGSQQRTRSRLVHLRRLEEKVINLISREFKGWLDASIKVINQKESDLIVEKIELLSTKPSEIKKMINFVNSSLINGNKLGLWEAVTTGVVLTIRREKPFRSFEKFSQLNEFRQLVSSFTQWIESEPSFTPSADVKFELRINHLASAICFSAMTFGGLLDKNILRKLIPILIAEKFECFNKRVWIDLHVKDRSKSITANEVSCESKLRRWFPDVLTLSLITMFHNLIIDEEDLYTFERNMKLLIKRLNKPGAQIRTINQLISTASIAYEVDNPSTLSFLQAYAIGKNESHSLPRAVFLKLIGKKNNARMITRSNLSLKKNPRIENIRKNEYTENDARIESVINRRIDGDLVLNELRKCFKGVGNTKVTPDSYIKNVKNFIAEYDGQLLPIEQLLTQWMIHLMKCGTRQKKKIAIGTAENYLSLLGVPILATIADADPLEFEEDDWYEVFDYMVENIQNRGSLVAQKTGRFQEFYEFLVIRYNAPKLDFPTSTYGHTSQQVVRSNYINENEYEHLLNSIDKIKNTSHFYRASYRQIGTIAYRCGLRKHELIKLRLKDLYQSSDKSRLYLRCRVNYLGNNKSTSAKRTLVLNHLLTPDELKKLESWLDLRRKQGGKEREPLFIQDDGGLKKLTKELINKVFSDRLKSICMDNSVTFHTLRHSAICNIYIVLFITQQNWFFLHNLYPKTPIEPSDLLSYGGIGSQKLLHALSTLAGHATPTQTMASYIHFMDIHQYFCRKQMPEKDLASTISAMLGQKLGSFARLMRRNSVNEVAIYASFINRIHPSKILVHKSVRTSKIEKKNQTVQKSMKKLDTIDRDNSDFTFLNQRVVLHLLQEYEMGKTIMELESEFGVSFGDIQNIVEIAQDVANIKTIRGSSRLISGRRIEEYQANNRYGNLSLISPFEPRSKLDNEFAWNLLYDNMKKIKSLSDLNKTVRPYIDSVKFWIENCTTSKPGLRFKSIAETEKAINLITKTVPKEHVFILHSISEGEYGIFPKDIFSKCHLGYRIKSTEGSSHFLVGVSLERFTKGGVESIPKATPAINFVMHLLAIILKEGNSIEWPY